MEWEVLSLTCAYFILYMTKREKKHIFNKLNVYRAFYLVLFCRLIWMMMVMAGLGLFVYQLAASLFIYFQYPVTVNIKINYNNSVVFPAVTICNQNAYK